MSQKRDRWKRKRARRQKARGPVLQAGQVTVDSEGGVSVGGKLVSPSDGSLVMTCGHEGSGNSFHWWHSPGEILEFTRPDGSTGQTHWMVACDPCFRKADGDVAKVSFRSDGKWDAQGGKPMKIKEKP